MITATEQLVRPISTAGFINIRQAMRRTGWSHSRIQRYALLGELRILVLPGRFPLYNMDDLDELKASEG